MQVLQRCTDLGAEKTPVASPPSVCTCMVLDEYKQLGVFLVQNLKLALQY